MDETEQTQEGEPRPAQLTIPCPKCKGRIELGQSGRVECPHCGHTRGGSKVDSTDGVHDDLRIVEVFPLEEGRVLCVLRSGVAVVHRVVSRSSMEPEGQATLPEIASQRLKVLPRTDGKWIVFDNLQPMARGDVQVCANLHAACWALGDWVAREEAEGIPIRTPAPRSPMPLRPRTMTQLAQASVQKPTALAPVKGITKAPAAPTSKRGRKWPGCAHRRFPGEDKCRFCAAQVLMPGVSAAHDGAGAPPKDTKRAQD